MTTIKIHYDKRSPQVVEEEEVVSGQRKTVAILFSFSKEWDIFRDKTAVFVSIAAEKSYPLDENGIVDIPEEIIINGVRDFSVSVAGVAEDESGEIQRYNGKPLRFTVTKGGNIPGHDVGDNCKPSAYEQLLIRVEKKLDANQGTENAGRAMVVGDDGIVRPGDYAGGGSGGGGGITQEKDPTVPAWAKEPNKPTYTPSEIGAQPAGDYALRREIPSVPVKSVNGKTGAVKLTASDVSALPASTKIPAKTSEITNDSGFITKAAADLVNYYTKSQTYTQEEIDGRISAIPKFSIAVVSALPTSGISDTTIYLVKSGTGTDMYTEYIYVGGVWEILGSQKVDLTGYATETWVIGKLADYLSATELQGAINTALAQAKASGEFDGAPGESGVYVGSGTPPAGTKVQVDPNGEAYAPGTIDDGGIPSYWDEHLKEKIEIIRGYQRAGGKDCYSFSVMSDPHAYQGKEPTYAPKLVKKVNEACNIKYCLCLGDIQSQSAIPNEDDFYKNWQHIHDMFSPARGKMLFTAGNHDGAWGRYDSDGNGVVDDTFDYYVYNSTREEIYDFIYRPVATYINGVVFNDTGDAYYVDDTVAKVRYLLLNSHWTIYKANENGTVDPQYNVMRRTRFGQNQQDFAVKALKTLPDNDWTVIVGCHMPIVKFDEGGGGDLTLFKNMLEAFQNRTTFNGTYGTRGEFDYVELNEDFTNAVGRVAVSLSGHHHYDAVNTDSSFPIVLVAADRNEEYAEPVLGTITEHSFDVMTVDKNKRVIYATKIGNGEDRVISIGGACLITMSIDNATAGNDAKSVLFGASYNTTITANVGYKLDAVTVLMGGVDITSTAYSNGTVSIAEVTGDVIVTVVTSKLFTNLIDINSEDFSLGGKMSIVDDQYVFEESPYNPAYPNVIFTNYIPVKQYDILRFRGIDLADKTGLGTEPTMIFYDENKQYVTKIMISSHCHGTVDGVPSYVVADENGVVEYEILIRGDTGAQFVYKDFCARAKYVRFFANRNVPLEEVVVTVNEEIL